MISARVASCRFNRVSDEEEGTLSIEFCSQKSFMPGDEVDVKLRETNIRFKVFDAFAEMKSCMTVSAVCKLKLDSLKYLGEIDVRDIVGLYVTRVVDDIKND